MDVLYDFQPTLPKVVHEMNVLFYNNSKPKVRIIIDCNRFTMIPNNLFVFKIELKNGTICK